ncbi:hypothetical protein PoB_006992700 [Plakobranchus ocellatus]|uniref:Uncharacterized protein n=1 Tax=Plakobranchus ocellatus TaxID=259542 RepID=A0AAV4DGN7_9GAST|nr:hypothetical protein PoB_006992700 [Plakobranchus ocellatus]
MIQWSIHQTLHGLADHRCERNRTVAFRIGTKTAFLRTLEQIQQGSFRTCSLVGKHFLCYAVETRCLACLALLQCDVEFILREFYFEHSATRRGPAFKTKIIK